MRALIVEDDMHVANAIEIAAGYTGMVCDCVTRGQDALSMIEKHQYDIISLDLGLPDMDGYDVLLRLRQLKIMTPVIMLSASREQAKKNQCLSNGAADYVTKPFDCAEFMQRVKNITQMTSAAASRHTRIVQIGDLVINFDERSVSGKNGPIKLTATEYTIMEVLAKRGTETSKAILLAAIYRHAAFNEHGSMKEPAASIKKKRDTIIPVFICKLKQKLKIAGVPEECITTVWGKGYSLKPVGQNSTVDQDAIHDDSVSGVLAH